MADPGLQLIQLPILLLLVAPPPPTSRSALHQDQTTRAAPDQDQLSPLPTSSLCPHHPPPQVHLYRLWLFRSVTYQSTDREASVVLERASGEFLSSPDLSLALTNLFVDVVLVFVAHLLEVTVGRLLSIARRQVVKSVRKYSALGLRLK